jgi:acid stress-induced BolA-like protein IbaG/YrbA
MPLKEHLTETISNPASGIAAPEFELEEAADGKVGGFIISPSFAGKSQLERQNILWDYLDQALTQEQALGIVSLVTITPEEAQED